MPFCPKCKDEYYEGFASCNDCDVPLVEKLVEKLPLEDGSGPDDPDDYANYSDIMDYKEYKEFIEQTTADIPALLCSVKDNMEAAVLESLLMSSNIPVMIKWRNAGDAVMLYMATSSTGADMYVPSRLLEDAKVLISAGFNASSELDDSSELSDSNETISDEEFLEYAKQKNLERSTKARKLLMVLFIPSLIVVVALILILLTSCHGYAPGG